MFVFRIGFCIVQDDLRFFMTLSFWSSCLCLPCVGTVGVHDPAFIYRWVFIIILKWRYYNLKIVLKSFIKIFFFCWSPFISLLRFLEVVIKGEFYFVFWWCQSLNTGPQVCLWVLYHWVSFHASAFLFWDIILSYKVAWYDFELTVYLRLALNLWSCCLIILSS